MGKLSPIESEFSTAEEAEAHDRWFREKVRKALKSDKPPVPHKQVIEEAREIIERKRRAASRLER